MEPRTSSREAEHSWAIEEAYRRGYHYGLTQAMDLIFGLLSSGIPTSAIADLCRVFVRGRKNCQTSPSPRKVRSPIGNSSQNGNERPTLQKA